MSDVRMLRLFVVATIGILLAWPVAGFAQQRCDSRAVVTVDTDVYDGLPRFVTGRGWQGNIKARLQANTAVFVCWEQTTQFGLTSKSWLQIAFRSNRGTVDYGWILKEATRHTAGPRDESFFARLSPIALAQAQTPPQQNKDYVWSPSEPPPQPPAPPTQITSGAQPENMIGELVVLYGPLFLAMVLGMLAKATVDWLDEPNISAIAPHLRSGLIAVLVSPIVFLGFLNAGQFSVTTQAYLVLMLLAFQNGFFWQTVLKRASLGDHDNKKT